MIPADYIYARDSQNSKNYQTVILVHGSLTPYFMGKDIYDTIQGKNKEIWTVDENGHCEMWIDRNLEYCDRVESFLSKYE